MRVLLVDDEAELVFTLAERLELRDLDVDATTSGEEALRWAAERSYDVAVVDLKMPGVGGAEVLRGIRRMHPAMPVILLTGHGGDDELDATMRQSVTALLCKPVQIEELIATMQRRVRSESDG